MVHVDVAGNITPVIGIVGQVSRNYKAFEEDDFDLNIHTFLAGVRGFTVGVVLRPGS